MFNYVRKSSSFARHWSHCSTTLRASSPTHENFQHCLTFSTTDAATTEKQSSTVSYLINTCGFSPESALSVSRNFQLKAPKKADAVISFFKSHGFSQTHISDIIRKVPVVLSSDPEKTLLPRLEFFYSKGLSSPDLALTFSKCPLILKRSLENHIIPNFNCFSDWFHSTERTIACIRSAPFFFNQDLGTHMAPRVKILVEYGVPKSKIFLYMKRWPYSFKTNLDVFREVVEEVKEMGMNPLRSQFVQAVIVKTAMSRTLWGSKRDVYMRWGWSEEEFLAAFKKYPWCVIVSEKKIMGTMDFFVNEMGCESSFIAKRPVLVAYSLQKRIIPRAAVFRFLLVQGLIKKSKHARLSAVFMYSEKAFLERFVSSYDEAPQLLKLYKEKLELSKVTK